MSDEREDSNPFAPFADAVPNPRGVEAYKARLKAERRHARRHWAARGIIIAVTIVAAVIAQSVADWQGVPGLGATLVRTTVRALLGALGGAGLAVLLLMLSSVSHAVPQGRRLTPDQRTVDGWLALFPLILTICIAIGTVVGILARG
jgi:hypothetical protein